MGPTLWRLGTLYERSFDLGAVVRPALAAPTGATGATSAFYVREDDRRIYLYRHHSDRLIRHHVEEGASLESDRGASARILMAFSGEPGDFYDRIRAERLDVSRGERDPETASIAVPVFSGVDGFVGALRVVGLRAHFDADRTRELSAQLRSAADALRQELGAF